VGVTRTTVRAVPDCWPSHAEVVVHRERDSIAIRVTIRTIRTTIARERITPAQHTTCAQERRARRQP